MKLIQNPAGKEIRSLRITYWYPRSFMRIGVARAPEIQLCN